MALASTLRCARHMRQGVSVYMLRQAVSTPKQRRLSTGKSFMSAAGAKSARALTASFSAVLSYGVVAFWFTPELLQAGPELVGHVLALHLCLELSTNLMLEL